MRAEATEDWPSEHPQTDRDGLERKLAGLHPDLADLYRVAVELLASAKRDKGVIVMISHAVRELANNLAPQLGLVEGVQLSSSVDTSTPVATLAKLWEKEGPQSARFSPPTGEPGLVELSGGSDESIQERIPARITESIYAAIEMVISAHSGATGNARQRQAFIAVGRSASPRDPTARLFGATFDFFMSYAHLDQAAGRDLPSERELQRQFANFEAIISARLGGFFDVVDELADIVDVANAKKPSNGESPDHTTDAQ
jgi:hypothetical protein